jgi:hypothetical protein
MMFVGNRPLRQRILEHYSVRGTTNFAGDYISYGYMGKSEAASALKPGEFGVFERIENDPRIFVRLTSDQESKGGTIEVSTRRRFLDFGAKKNVVLRNLVITRFANSLGAFYPDYPIEFRKRFSDDRSPENILVDRCRFEYNNGHGFNIVGRAITLLDSHFSYNGFSGINGDSASDIVFQRNTTNFNGWRAFWGEETGWFTAGVKMHQTKSHKVLGHTVIGNAVGGFWYDIFCSNIYNQDIVALANPWGFMWELSQGPFHGKRLLSIGGKSDYGSSIRIWEVSEAVVEQSVFWHDYPEHNNGPTSAFHIALTKRSSEQTDEHARLERIIPKRIELRDSVIATGSNSRVAVAVADFRPAERQQAAPPGFRFARNLYFSPKSAASLLWEAGASFGDRDLWSPASPKWKDNLHAYEKWALLSKDSQSEVLTKAPVTGGSEWNLALTLPQNHRQRMSNLPTYRLPDAVRAEMDWFFTWSGFSPTAWPAIPDQDTPPRSPSNGVK